MMGGELEHFRRRWNQQKADSWGLGAMSAGPTRCSGQFQLDGAGEAEVQITFPVSFSAKPLLSFSGEVRDGDILVSARMPSISMMVLRWTVEDNPPYSVLYTGAVLGVVTSGPPGTRMYATWHMDGTAFTNHV